MRYSLTNINAVAGLLMTCTDDWSHEDYHLPVIVSPHFQR